MQGTLPSAPSFRTEMLNQIITYMDLSSINWLAVIVATVASFGVGFLWYGPLFGKAWQKLMGFSEEEMKNANMVKIFGLSFLFTLIGGILLAAMMPVDAGLAGGMTLGAVVGAGFIATSMGTTAQFARTPTNLLLIDAGYMVVVYVVMGLIIGVWQ